MNMIKKKNNVSIQKKFEQLKLSIVDLKSVIIAFSGGVDSSFLSKVCFDALGINAVAITIKNPLLSESEFKSCGETARLIGIKHIIIEDAVIEKAVALNPANRCYYCKKKELGLIIKKGKELGIHNVLDGSNIDDINDYRPGAKALDQLKIISPLQSVKLTKNEIRLLSKKLELPTFDKPAYACLASRIPYNEEITLEKLKKIEKAEDILKKIGIRQCRVRCHNNIARIETAPEERRKLFDTALLDKISSAVKALGFIYVCFEFEGYKTGSLNAEIDN